MAIGRVTKTASLAAVACVATSIFASDLTPEQAAFRALYQELVEINTSLSANNCIGATKAMAAHLRSTGYAETDIHLIAPPDRPTKSNLVAVLHGTDKHAKAILLLAHIDVVEAKREDWVRDPFKLIEEDGYFYGRGSLDDKAMAAIFTDAMMRYQKDGYRPKRDIKLALTCGEETPDDFDGARYLVENHRELIDAEFAINEGGGGLLDKDGVRIFNGVEAGEKVSQHYRLEVTNPGGHSSRPVKDNAIYQLAAGLSRLAAYQFPIEFNDTTRGFFERMSTIRSGQVGADLRAILGTSPDAAAMARLVADPNYNNLLHTTCVATMLDGGHAPNGLPQRAGAIVNCRIFPGTPQEAVRQTLEQIVADPAIKVTFVAPPELASPPPQLTRSVLGPIEKITQQTWPGVPVLPMMLAAGTDARFLTPNGIPTYGVSGIFADPETTHAHGLNERVKVESLYEGRDFLDQLIRIYANRP